MLGVQGDRALNDTFSEESGEEELPVGVWGRSGSFQTWIIERVCFLVGGVHGEGERSGGERAWPQGCCPWAGGQVPAPKPEPSEQLG